MFFFFNDTATTEIYTLSLHDALPICGRGSRRPAVRGTRRHSGLLARRRGEPRGLHGGRLAALRRPCLPDRKSTRLNSSHANISYAVFCLKKNTTPTLSFPHSYHHASP